MTAAVDPRTILANALKHLTDDANGWTRHAYGWRHTATDTDVLVDREGIDLVQRASTYYADRKTLDEFSVDEGLSVTAARAVDHLVADGILPLRLSTGYQLAAQEWAGEVRQAREATALAEQHLRQAVAETDRVTHEHVKLVGEYVAQIAELEQQLADARGHQPDGTVVELPAVAA